MVTEQGFFSIVFHEIRGRIVRPIWNFFTSFEINGDPVQIKESDGAD